MAKAMVVQAGTPDEGPRSLKIGLVFWAVALVIIVAGLVWLGPTETLDINSRDFFPLPAGFAFFSAAFGTYYVGRGVLLNLRFGKYGVSTLDAGPAAPGRVFKGRIRTQSDLSPQGPFSLRLLCVRESKTEGDSDDNGSSGGSIVTTPLWEAVASAPVTTRSSAGIPFEFAIPADALPSLTRPYSEGPNIKWTLHAAAALKGLDYSATFPITVGGSGKSSKAANAASAAKPFAGSLRPEQTWARIARFVAPVLGVLFFCAGGYNTLNQIFHGGIPLAGKIVSINMPSLDVALDEGGVVKIARVTRNHTWRVDQPVSVTCVEEGNTLRSCRMDTGGDRWIDGLGTLAVGTVLLLLGGWLWRRYLRYRQWMSMRTE